MSHVTNVTENWLDRTYVRPPPRVKWERVFAMGVGNTRNIAQRENSPIGLKLHHTVLIV